jgi:hypothetical protein
MRFQLVVLLFAAAVVVCAAKRYTTPPPTPRPTTPRPSKTPGPFYRWLFRSNRYLSSPYERDRRSLAGVPAVNGVAEQGIEVQQPLDLYLQRD